MNSRIQVVKGIDGFIESGTITLAGRKKLSFIHTWDATQLLDSIDFTGSLDSLPTSAEMYQMAAQNVHTDNLIDFTGPAAIQPTIWKVVDSISTLSTIIWTPKSGKTIQLLGGIITLSADLATSGGLTIELTGSSILIVMDVVDKAMTANNIPFALPFSFPGNGYIGPVNGTISLDPTGAGANITAGTVSVSLWGNEI